MSTDGGPAFPAHENWRIDSGMTLRDYFAARALQNLVGLCQDGDGSWAADNVAQNAYMLADAMLAERAK